MRAVYVLIVLGFLRRLLRRVLAPTGKYLWRHGGYVLCLEVGGEDYGIVCFGKDCRTDEMLMDLLPSMVHRVPRGCAISLREGRLGDMRTWQEIADDDARQAAIDIGGWWTLHGRKYL